MNHYLFFVQSNLSHNKKAATPFVSGITACGFYLVCLLKQFHKILKINNIYRRVVKPFQYIVMMVVRDDETRIGCYRTINKLVIIRILSYQRMISSIGVNPFG